MVMKENKLSSIVSENSQVERLATGFKFTEGPVWNTSEGCILFSDIPANRIYKWSEGEPVTIFLEPSGNSNGLTYDRDGQLIICEHGTRRLSRLDKEGGYQVLADRYHGKRLNSPNDVVIKSDGKIYFTDPPYGIEPEVQELKFQGVFFLDTERKVLKLLVDDFERPNGLAFSPEERVLYVADSSSRRHIRAFDVEKDGTLNNGRVFAEIRSEIPGNPDGMKPDVEGNLYVAAAGGVWIFTKEGERLGIIQTPERPSNLAWGGTDLGTLIITARTSLYRIDVKTTGVKTS